MKMRLDILDQRGLWTSAKRLRQPALPIQSADNAFSDQNALALLDSYEKALTTQDRKPLAFLALESKMSAGKRASQQRHGMKKNA